jgi:hypothetical protein
MRLKAGVAELKPDPRLRGAAGSHAILFAARQDFSVQYPNELTLRQRIDHARVPCVDVGEIQLMLPDIGTDDDELRAEDAMRTESALRTILNPKFSVAMFAVIRDGMSIYAVGDFVSPVRVLPAEKAEELFLIALQEMRRPTGLRRFAVTPLIRLRKAACEMARKDSLAEGIDIVHMDSQTGEEVRSVFTFTTGDPEKISSIPQVAELANARPRFGHRNDQRTISIGACLASSATYPNGTYWFIVALYDN